MGKLIGLTNKELCNGLLRAIYGANYKATWRYVTYILHKEMNIKSNGTDVMIVRMIPRYFAARKFFGHLANVWCEKGKGERWTCRKPVRRLNSYISTQAVAEIIRLLASKENQFCRSFAEEFLMSFLHFFTADGNISVALDEVLASKNAEAKEIAEKLTSKISKKAVKTPKSYK